MTSRDFCYWLQGFIEVGQPHIVTQEQLATIRAHLAMVFHHEIDPSHGNHSHVEELRKIHEGKDPTLECKKETSEQFPDGAPVTLPKSLVDILPKDWPLGVDFAPKMNC